MLPALGIGLMSGSSADGVTAALARFSEKGVRVLRYQTLPYRRALRERVLGASELQATELSRLNFELGAAFADAARAVMRGARPGFIGSHGQTIWHGPDDKPAHTFQLGEPAVIAERTGLPVVADFRPRDIASGGQGAPLVPAFDEWLFAKGPLRALVNIGGIANVTVVGEGRLREAYDTGPGNCLMDLAVRLATRGRRSYDEDGRLAAAGWADFHALKRMLGDPYFKRRAPKSLERTRFGEAFLRRHLGRPIKPLPELLSTLAWLTATTVADACRKRRVREIVVSGGGALNPSLLAMIADLSRPVPVRPSDDFGIPVMAKEAACFAWLAWRALSGKPNNAPRATGARGPRILGKVVPA